MAKQSLAAQTGSLAGDFKLPAVFSPLSEPLKAREWPPYVTFAHSKRPDEWTKISAEFKNVAEGDMFLVEKRLHRLDQMKASMVACQQYWAEINAKGEMVQSSAEELPRPFKEHIEAVLLVYLEDRVIPANVQFRTVKCPAAKQLSDALIESSKPSWAEKSPEHRETLVCAQPFMRFYGVVTLGPSRTSKSSGMPYRPTLCSVYPTGVPEWRLLKAFFDGPDAEKALGLAAARYQERLAEVLKKRRAA